MRYWCIILSNSYLYTVARHKIPSPRLSLTCSTKVLMNYHQGFYSSSLLKTDQRRERDSRLSYCVDVESDQAISDTLDPIL